MPPIQSHFNTEGNNKLLLRVTCLCWLAVKLLGWRMFTAYRLFPTAPVFNSLNQIPVVVHTILFLFSILLLVTLFLLPQNKLVCQGLLIAELLSFMLDVNRVQPWDYQYLFIVFIFIINANNQKQLTALFALVIISTYFYSGLGKLNNGFLQTIWSKMLLRMYFKVPAKIALQSWVYYSGLMVGIIESVAATGLLFLKTRKTAAIILILMHLFILLFLGPLGINYNRIVWPWNIAMICFLYLIFLKNKDFTISFKTIFSGWNILFIICWGILPALNFAGYWDNYLSSGIYSGKLPRMLICIKDTSQCRTLKRFFMPNSQHLCNGTAIIDLQYWSMTETNMAPYPEMRAYKEIETKLKNKYKAAGLNFIYLNNYTKR